MKQQGENTFIKEIQDAFQKSYENEFGKYDKMILPVEDIEESFNTKGAEAYIAEVNGKRVGGTIIVIDDECSYASLHLLYVKSDSQNAGYGIKIWNAIEGLHPNIKIWETHTPYYDKRNIHFYVNRYGFKIVEFFQKNQSIICKRCSMPTLCRIRKSTSISLRQRGVYQKLFALV